MTEVGGRTVTIGRSTDIENNNGYELELDVNTNQLIIRDQSTGNEITADVGRGFIQDVVQANTELRLPTYADNANAVQEDAQIWFNDGSGADAAGVYHYDGGVVGPLETGAGSAPANLSGLTIDTDKDWGGYIITGAGRDGVDVPSSVDLLIDDFESGNLDTWTGSTGQYVVQETTVKEGSFAVKQEANSTGGVGIQNVSGLPSYPQPGDTWEYFGYRTDGGDQHFFRFAFGGTGQYSIVVDGSGIEIRKDNSGLQLTNTPDLVNEWFRVEVEWTLDRQIIARLYDDTDSLLGEVSATDTQYDSGGVELNGFNSGSAPIMYWDGIKLTRRTREFATDTKKSTTRAGNELTPSGGVQTGPQEASLNALRQTYAEAPVDDTSTRAQESILTLLQSGVSPAVLLRRIMDGEGGTYSHQLESALGKFSRKDAALAWGYESLSDSEWNGVDDGTGVYTIQLTDNPRRVQISTSGDGGQVNRGGVVNPAIVTPSALDHFALTFKGVEGSAEANVDISMGITDVDITANNPASTGNGVLFEDPLSDNTTDLTVVSGGTATTNNGPTAVSFSSTGAGTMERITIEYDGSSARLVAVAADGQQYVVTVDASTSGLMRPFILLEDGDSAAEAFDLYVDEVTLEPLAEVLQ